MDLLRLWWRDLTDLFCPELCVTCHRPLMPGEHTLCMYCLQDMPFTHSEQETDNAVSRLFWGFFPVANATALFYYHRGSRYHALLHRFKYEGDRRIGHDMGHLMGSRMQGTPFAHADCLIPVPLHPDRLRARGYNQSRCIADGLSDVLHLPVEEHALARNIATTTQTHSGRWERFNNVRHIFALQDKDLLAGRHVILVDDVITTGATISACAETLMQVPGVTISVAALAVAAE